jgi:hypothetical protein
VGAADNVTVTILPLGGEIASPQSPLSTLQTEASTGSSTEAAISFLIPVAMLVTPFILSWWGKVKRTPRLR